MKGYLRVNILLRGIEPRTADHETAALPLSYHSKSDSSITPGRVRTCDLYLSLCFARIRIALLPTELPEWTHVLSTDNIYPSTKRESLLNSVRTPNRVHWFSNVLLTPNGPSSFGGKKYRLFAVNTLSVPGGIRTHEPEGRENYS